MLRNAFLSTFVANFVTNLLASGSVLILAIFLEAPDIADIRTLQAYIVIGITIASLGFTTGILKYCSLSREEINNEHLLKQAVFLTLGASLCYFFVASAIATILPSNGSNSKLRTLLPIALISVPLGVAIELLRNFLYAQNRFEAAASAQIFVRLWTFAITITLAYAYGLFGYIVGTVASFLFGVIRFAKEVPFSFSKVKQIDLPAGFVKFSAFAMLGNLFVIVGNYGDILLLDSMNIERSVLGAYALASALAGGIMVITTSIQTVISPDMIRGTSSPHDLRRTFIRNQLRLAILSIGVAIFAIGFVALIFPKIYSDKYLLTPMLFAGLCANYVLVSCGTLGGSVLIGYGKTSVNTMIAGTALFVGFFSGYFFISTLDVWGMVWAKLIYGLVFVLLSNMLALKCLKAPQPNKESK